MVAAGVPVVDRLAFTVDRDLAVRPGHLRVPEHVVEDATVTHLQVAGLEEGGRAATQADVEGETELRIVEPDALDLHRLDDVEPERPDREVVGPRPQSPREADVALLAGHDRARVAVHHVRVRMQPEPHEDVEPGTVEREVVAVVEVRVGGRRDVDRESAWWNGKSSKGFSSTDSLGHA